MYRHYFFPLITIITLLPRTNCLSSPVHSSIWKISTPRITTARHAVSIPNTYDRKEKEELRRIFQGEEEEYVYNNIKDKKNYKIETLCNDPHCFLVHDVLTKDECEGYISRLQTLSDGDRLQQSNGPQISLDTQRLWPLAFLAPMAGLPPILRLLLQSQEDHSPLFWEEIIRVSLPPTGIAILGMITLLFGITRGIELYSTINNKNSLLRSSQSLALNTQDDCDFIRPLVERVTDIVSLQDINSCHWSQWEAPVITKYEKGAKFASHNDASLNPQRDGWDTLGGQRIYTVITYLTSSKDGGGGETQFDQLNLKIKPQRGCSLVFFPALQQKQSPINNKHPADGRTIHQSLPAIDEKYIVQMFGRVHRVPSPLGIPNSYE